MLMLGMATEFHAAGIACNALWPRTAIATAVIEFALGGEAMTRRLRTSEIVADAAHAILTSPSPELTGRLLLDEAVLAGCGMSDFSHYAVTPDETLQPDLVVAVGRWEALASGTSTPREH